MFGVKLKALREQQGLSQLALAKRARINQGYLAQLEAGDRRNPSLAILGRLAKALRVTVTELLE